MPRLFLFSIRNFIVVLPHRNFEKLLFYNIAYQTGPNMPMSWRTSYDTIANLHPHSFAPPQDLGWALIIRICNKCLTDADADDPGTTLWKSLGIWNECVWWRGNHSRGRQVAKAHNYEETFWWTTRPKGELIKITLQIWIIYFMSIQM